MFEKRRQRTHSFKPKRRNNFRQIIVPALVMSILAAGVYGFQQSLIRGPKPRGWDQLPVSTLVIESKDGALHSFQVEMATTPQARSRGLQERKKLGKNEGMFFWFDEPKQVRMWMKDTPLPLDIIFIRQNSTIAGIAAHTRPYSMEEIPAPEPVIAVLELNAGRANALNIKSGDNIRHAYFLSTTDAILIPAATIDEAPAAEQGNQAGESK
jgi:uncharacterized membrane protein (UPF0127 family)